MNITFATQPVEKTLRERIIEATAVSLHNRDLYTEQTVTRVTDALQRAEKDVNPTGFEELIAQLLTEIGFEDIEVTKKTGDGGTYRLTAACSAFELPRKLAVDRSLKF